MTATYFEDMSSNLLGGDDFTEAQKALADTFGSKEDDKLCDDGSEKNDKVDAYIEELGDCNYYTCMALLMIDPDQGFETFRGNAKMFLLPAFQILVPAGMCYYFLVTHDMFSDNGYCCNHANYVFRFTGFVTFMYSGWQIIDGCDDASSKFFLKRATAHWSLTGSPYAFKEMWMFYLCYLSQTVCSLLLLIVTYIIYTNQSDTPLDLLMNCVAVNFVLDIDAEWMSDKQQEKSQNAAKFLFKRWRDACIDQPDVVKAGMQKNRSLRRQAPMLMKNVYKLGDFLVTVLVYLFVVGWTFCPPGY